MGLNWLYNNVVYIEVGGLDIYNEKKLSPSGWFIDVWLGDAWYMTWE